MKLRLPIIFLPALLFTTLQVAAEDVSQGTILALDRKAKIMVLTDRSSWPLENLKAQAPGALKAGDRVRIEYESSEDGISAINRVEIINN